MNRDEIKQANEIWTNDKDTINAIAKLDLSTHDFVQARIWPRIAEIERNASTDLVRLAFQDKSNHSFADDGYVDFEFAVLVKKGDEFERPTLPILLKLDTFNFQGLSISLILRIPEEKSKYRDQFLAALLPLKDQIKESLEYLDSSVELAEIEIMAKDEGFDIDALVDQLPNTMQRVTKRILEPLAVALRKG